MLGSLAGSLTSAVVGIAKDKLAAAIVEQANSLWNFGDDLEDMNSMLETISAALQDAERRSAKEKLVQLWLKQLKHAALEIADMLEDYQDNSERLTAKKPGVLSWMKSMREELRKINKDFRDFNFSESGTCTSLERHDEDRETSSRLPEEPIGRNREKQEIINLLSAGTKNDETVIVSIHGLGGIGKSTLAQLIYNDAQFKKYDHRIWVYVSRDFSLKKIGSSIISLIPIEGGQQNRDTLEAINQCLDNLLRGKKVLIVLDDLWEEKDTVLGKLRSMLQVGKGTTIDVIVTTRKEDIARKVSTCTPYKLQPLNDYTCWEIIKRYSRFEDQHYQERLEKIGLDIAKKCGGVALAAQALGYMLQSKDLSGWTEINNSDIWNESFEDNGGVLPSLKLSYERMQPQLRICFSYCAIFPKGHNIAKDDLIHQWISLGFIEPSMGKEYTRQLLGMSFLEVSKLPKFGATVQGIQCDNGREFDNLHARTFFLSHGIHLRISCPYTSAQNGKAERIIRSINNVIRTLLIHASIPPTYWAAALGTVTYLLNILPTKTLSFSTPHYTLLGSPPSYEHLRVFGCKCYPNLAATAPHKLSPHSSLCVFLGYSPHHKGYLCLDRHSNRVIISRHVVFDESSFPFLKVRQHQDPMPAWLGLPPNQCLASYLAPTRRTPRWVARCGYRLRLLMPQPRCLAAWRTQERPLASMQPCRPLLAPPWR
ncbi:putative disease resistance protein RGA1 isoform X3 [Setaria italica]|uniref:putative disease resistance protein RGA1 isoform X3 n=1 Tax=Setaria italica TaxID=4555 RepID=UPI000BE549FE|nr:putative disease resistance protein RGA1 isoform X3 [Setaria italica]